MKPQETGDSRAFALRTLLIALALLLAMAATCCAASWGMCGELVWSLSDDGVLTIEGTGEMEDYDHQSPWSEDDSVTSLKIYRGITHIGNYAFQGCIFLTGPLSIPDSVTTIGECAFSVCDRITGSLLIPDSVTTIGSGAFYFCSGFTGSLSIPDSVSSIGEAAFAYCSGFTGSLLIPDSVTSIGYGAFSGCDNLSFLCHAGSYAQQWLEENQIPYQLVGDTPTPPQTDKFEIGFYRAEHSQQTVDSFEYVKGSIVPVVNSSARHISEIVLEVKMATLAVGEKYNLTVRLPEGFSFSYNEIVREKQFVGASQIVNTYKVYPLYLEHNPGSVTVEVSGDLSKTKTYQVANTANSLIYAEKKGYSGAIPANRLWSNMSAGFNGDMCWLGDLLSFPDDIRSNPGGTDETPLNLETLGFLDAQREQLDKEDDEGLECYFGVRSFIKNGKVRHVVCMVNIGQYESAQWLGNFTVFGLRKSWGLDYAGYHIGFRDMADKLKAKLLNYCDTMGVNLAQSGIFLTGRGVQPHCPRPQRSQEERSGKFLFGCCRVRVCPPERHGAACKGQKHP